MKKIIVGLVGLMVILLPCQIAFAFGRGGSFSGSRGNFSSSNRYGCSTSHSYGSTSHSNAYGGSTSHTAGQGTTHDRPTAPARHTITVEVRLIRTPTGVKLRVSTEKELLTRTPMAGPLRVPTAKERLIPTFTVAPRPARTGKARITRARMAMALRTIHPLPTMAIIHRPR